MRPARIVALALVGLGAALAVAAYASGFTFVKGDTRGVAGAIPGLVLVAIGGLVYAAYGRR